MANNQKRTNLDNALVTKGLSLSGPLNHHQLETLMRTADASGCSVTFTGSALTVVPT
jgi:hypothetical protein